MLTENDPRRAGIGGGAEVFIKDPWCAAALACLGEPVMRVERRRDDTRRVVWVFAARDGALHHIIDQIYQQGEASLMPAMALRSSYKHVLRMAEQAELETFRGSETP